MRQGITSHRQTVLDVIKTSKDHPTARTIFKRASKKTRKLSFATVYNSLKYLTAHGLIRQFQFGDEAVRYDAVLARHDHLICRRCYRVEDVTDLRPPRVGLDFPEPKAFKVEEVSMQLIGLCQRCRGR